ncbi:sensor domain-containing diguanylate cyclase [Solimonas variicoloris]|uniref:sensor domain-containing diguanylate cyclase n=1 Tax=Solimonas variicoloris TaxID=254408 RepID=UPI00036F5AD9|nr:sensor domain-containing diguanylate cyclase [Solimonas variicoloris]
MYNDTALPLGTYPPLDFAEPLPADPVALRSGEYEQLLQREPRRYADLVRSVSAFGIYLIDRDGRVGSWNRGARNLSGWREDEVIGRPYEELLAEPGPQREANARRALDFARAHGHCRDEQRRRRPDGSVLIVDCTLDAVRGDNGELVGFVEVFHDITEQKERQNELYERATRDTLTQVFNRSHFVEVAAQEVERARRFAEPLSVVLFDIDQFRKLNETWGSEVGDRALQTLARAAQQPLRKIDSIGRLGGDEFAILLPRCDKEPALEVAQRLRLHLSEQKIATEPGQRNITITVSGGLAALRPLTRDFGELLRNADAALYKAKREGKNLVRAWFE